MGLRRLAFGCDERGHIWLWQIGEKDPPNRGGEHRQPRADADVHGEPVVALLHGDQDRAGFAPNRSRHCLVDLVAQCRQRIANLGDRIDPAQCRKPDRDRLRAELIEARVGLLRHQPGGAQAAQIAVRLGPSQPCLGRECFERHSAACLGQCIQYPRRNGDRLHAAAIGRAPLSRSGLCSLHGRTFRGLAVS